MGTMEEALLQGHGPEMETVVVAATEPNSTSVWVSSLVASYLSCRSGDELADGGHMIVPSTGQVMGLMSSTSFAPSSANDRPGNAHMTPLTWQKVKIITMNRSGTRLNMEETFYRVSVEGNLYRLTRPTPRESMSGAKRLWAELLHNYMSLCEKVGDAAL